VAARVRVAGLTERTGQDTSSQCYGGGEGVVKALGGARENVGCTGPAVCRARRRAMIIVVLWCCAAGRWSGLAAAVFSILGWEQKRSGKAARVMQEAADSWE
jgi:hypothetical protein